MELVVYFFIGVLFSGVISYVLYRNMGLQKTVLLNEKIELQNVNYTKLENQKIELQSDKENLLIKLSSRDAQLIAANEKLELQKKELETMADTFKFEFKNLAQNILEEKTEKFTLLNEEKMKAILDPLKSDIGEFKKKVQDTYDKESKERFSLEKEVGRLIEMSQKVSLEANNLTTALKGNNKVQGNWGEMILESLLENSG